MIQKNNSSKEMMVRTSTIPISVDEHRRLFLKINLIGGISLLVLSQQNANANLSKIVIFVPLIITVYSKAISSAANAVGDVIEAVESGLELYEKYFADAETEDGTCYKIKYDSTLCISCGVCIDEFSHGYDFYPVIETCPMNAFYLELK